MRDMKIFYNFFLYEILSWGVYARSFYAYICEIARGNFQTYLSYQTARQYVVQYVCIFKQVEQNDDESQQPKRTSLFKWVGILDGKTMVGFKTEVLYIRVWIRINESFF